MFEVHYTGRFFKGLTEEMQSPSYSSKITYEVGKTYDVDTFEISDDECGPGIHIFTSLGAALRWGPVVIEVTLPAGAQIVWSADKLRTSQVSVLSIISLSGADLSGADLSGAYLSGADLRGAYLSSADLRSADLRGANLRGANLSGANFRGANLSSADLSGADLSGANLRSADLSGAYLSGAYLSGADLSGANLSSANLRGANLSSADLRGAENLDKVIDLAKTIGEPASLPEGWQYSNGLIVPKPS